MGGDKKEKTGLEKIKQLNKQYKELNEELKKLHSKVELAVNLKRDIDKYNRNHEEKKAEEAKEQLEAANFHAMRYKEVLLKKYGTKLWAQMMTFFGGPESSDDKSVEDWIIKTYPSVRLLMNSDFMRFNPIPELENLSTKLRIPSDLAIVFFSEKAPDNVFFGSDSILDAEEGHFVDKVFEAESNYNSFVKGRGYKNFLKNLSDGLRKYIKPEPEPDYYNEDKAKIDGFVTKLKNAKTTFNSDEYKSIYNLAEELNKKEKAPKTENMYLSGKENYTVKLFALKNAIDAYIEHKGKDGVKRNVYNKLAAVEELNKFVISKIQELKPDTFWAGSNKIDASTVKSEDLSKEFSDVKIDDNLKKAKAEYGFTGKKAECRNVLDCMGRIIKKAAADNRGEKQINDLKQMRQDFFEKPGKEIPPVKDKQAAKAVL